MKKRYRFSGDMWMLSACIVFAVVMITVKVFLAPCVVVGESMMPTFKDGQYLKTDTHFKTEDIQLGDVVCFRNPENGKMLIKRVVGCPGDTVQIVNGKVVLNDEVMEEDYALMDDGGKAILPITLGEDEFFVLGDNRNNSYDSRFIGPIQFEQITNIVR